MLEDKNSLYGAHIMFYEKLDGDLLQKYGSKML